MLVSVHLQAVGWERYRVIDRRCLASVIIGSVSTSIILTDESGDIERNHF